MFIPNDGGFWRNQEQANGFVHFVFGMLISYALWLTGCGYWSLFGCSIGILEMFRQIIFDKPEITGYWCVDKVRDFAGYLAGSLFTLIIKNFPIG
jgi:hypothetical protein